MTLQILAPQWAFQACKRMILAADEPKRVVEQGDKLQTSAGFRFAADAKFDLTGV